MMGRLAIFGGLASSGIVFIVGILNRFHIDPLGTYRGVSENDIHWFLSTIGGINFYAMYLCLMMAAGLFLFWHADGWKRRALLGAYLGICSMSLVTQDSDSAYIGLFAMFSALLMLSLDDARKMERLLEAVLLCLLSFKFMGLLRQMFPDRAEWVDALSEFFLRNGAAWGIIATLALAYALLRIRRLRGGAWAGEKGIRIIRAGYLGLVITALSGAVLYIALNTAGMLPPALRSDSNYFLFGPGWGHDRGAVWTDAAIAMGGAARENPREFLIGSGPDTFALYVYNRRFEEMDSVILHATGGKADALFMDGHNEWLTALINYGLIGGIAYLGIFICGIIRMWRNRGAAPEAQMALVCAASYVAQNIFCYQIFFDTPLMFLILGIGEAAVRRAEKGK